MTKQDVQTAINTIANNDQNKALRVRNVLNDILNFATAYVESTAPTASDDVTQGYENGAIWIDDVTEIIYILVDNSTGAAVWSELAKAGVSADVGNDLTLGTDGLPFFQESTSAQNMQETYDEGNTINGATVIYDGTVTDGINAAGLTVAANNTGGKVNAYGEAAATNNTGDDVNGLGYYAAINNTGNSVNSLGNFAGNGNTGTSVNGLGTAATMQNTGSDVNAMGNSAARSNLGSDVNAIGFEAARGNTGTGVYVNAIGRFAARDNSGANVNAIGQNAANANSGDNVNGLGVNATRLNEGDNVNGFGTNAANGNTGNHVTAIGLNAGLGNTLANSFIIGAAELPTFADPAAAALAITVALGATANNRYLYVDLTDDTIKCVIPV
jgi:hypothetical protein